ncbi:ABC transporter ATP-binding protein [Chamaesiphon minutus]|uniref:ABC-type nitrate/sulfonate/bicarbonate transport system, ATPase component n=1 Tax=Chamaesiphon minutus (strain ATCC 27169 / PCC 6605) TaxID=1173020 RepID=K9ULZ1_CHAP6|nr:ABC transporter ATP-binding protein [Chamaesiphon minutus]AFY95456.1 ABC-type nitrate/sulfonate/bicarbonate transport system, ATPase component [Chamaesiphon minutus PCC 6605]
MNSRTLQEQTSVRLLDRQAPKLSIEHLSKSYPVRGDRHLNVLQDINLEIFPREFICLVGASGCGKSTLLNIIAGLTPPSSGAVLIDGRSVTGKPGSDRGMVFQGYTLYPWLTVAQNIAFGLQFQQMSKSAQREKVGYFLNVVGLEKFANSYPKQLSGGMKQRVAIARALANEPAVLLMDEPFGALDAQTKEQMQEFLLELWSKTHVTVLMITHDVEEAIYLSQRVYVLSCRPGRVQSEILVDLPEHRELDIKLAPEFVAIKRQVLQLMRQE